MTAPTVTPLPTAPSRNVADPDAYIGVADTWAAALPTFGAEVQAAGEYANTKAVAAAGSATAATEAKNDAVEAQGLAEDAQEAAEAAAATATTKALEAAGSAATSAGWKSTSTTSMALTAGSKTLTIEAGKQFSAGTDIKVKRTSAPTTSCAYTTVSTYNSGTGELTFTLSSDLITGSGTYTDWTVELSGGRGATGAAGTVPDSVNTDIVAAFLYISELQGTVTGMGNGVADSFEDTSGVDAASSTGETYDGTNDLYTNASVLPLMTASNLPSGYVASASSESDSSVAAWKAFDGSDSSLWYSSSASVPAWLKLATPAAITVSSYTVQAGTGSDANKAPRAWTLQGSNDNSAWTDLDSQSTQTFSSGEIKSYEVSSGSLGSYAYHRLNITTAGTGGSYHVIAEFKMSPINAMSLRSEAFTATSAPTTARITVAADLNGGTVNTDLIAYASRDGGTTWTAITLTAGRALPDGTTIYEGTGSISAQPSGTSMKWRIDTSDDYLIPVSAVTLQWS